MPKKKQTEPPDEQSKRFIADAQRMIDAGELSHTEGDEGLERALGNARSNHGGQIQVGE